MSLAWSWFARFVLAVLLAGVALALSSMLSFVGLGLLFGFTGHPAGPDIPAGCYTAFAIGGPILALAGSFLFVFRRRRPNAGIGEEKQMTPGGKP